MAKEIEWVEVERGELRPASPPRGFSAVSYTHLTLRTSDLV